MDNTHEERLATLEAEHRGLTLQVMDVKTTIINLRDNHLAHLSDDVKELTIAVMSRPTWLTTSIVAVLSSAVVGLLVALVKR